MNRTATLAAGGLLAFAAALSALAAPAPERLPQVEPRRHKDYVETIPGTTVRFEMVAVPGGTFRMGSPETRASWSAHFLA